ncbi:hypothetical protein CA850_19270 [Micromonospora echinospora]|nr:hypothetical protein CA850_19270 [Micromonospora echinospora]
MLTASPQADVEESSTRREPRPVGRRAATPTCATFDRAPRQTRDGPLSIDREQATGRRDASPRSGAALHA